MYCKDQVPAYPSPVGSWFLWVWLELVLMTGTPVAAGGQWAPSLSLLSGGAFLSISWGALPTLSPGDTEITTSQSHGKKQCL